MIRIGLLPFYIALYDESWPDLRARLEKFYEKTAQDFEVSGFDVIRSPFCRISSEFKSAIEDFEREGVQCIITLHLAYSPSLESSEELAHTKLPIIVLDITECHDFSPQQDPNEILYCHGVHGVMDMCNLLIRNGKRFSIVAGHPEHSDVMERACGFIRAAISANSLSGSCTGRIGGIFSGMGDFAVTDTEMHDRFGVAIIEPQTGELAELMRLLSQKEIDAELDYDMKNFQPAENISKKLHAITVENCLAVRKWIVKKRLSAFTINFSDIGSKTELSTMPFMEACKSMARGVGYAGEGDVLTASFVGALMKGYPDTSFVEIFCPDWKGNMLFISHMGEMNIRLAAGKPEMAEKDFPFGSEENPIACFGCFKSGEAVFLNVFRGQNDFCLLLCPVTMEAPNQQNDRFTLTIRGWMRPEISVSNFLEKLSIAGATHHSILIYDTKVEQLRYFGELLGMEIVEL